MSSSTSRPDDLPALPDRYASLELDEDILVYDRKDAEAWVQSSWAIDLEGAR